MPEPLKIAVAGLGRMGLIHALHVAELARETGSCKVAAFADLDTEKARNFAAEIGCDVPILSSVDELAASKLAEATVLVTPTENHREHSATLIQAGTARAGRETAHRNRGRRSRVRRRTRPRPSHSLMLAFQRRFDPPLRYARELMDSGIIGRVFKIYSSLEDSNPAPNGYKSGGILPDMSIHNVDEILWLTGRMPERALVIGANIYSHALTTSEEDFDDALLYMWFPDRLVSQVQVSRNHVSGYRVETIIFGEEGQIHVGRFDQKLFDITVEAYGRRDAREPLAHRTFPMRNYSKPLPEFVDRFGSAYKEEVAVFVECCRTASPSPSPTATDCARRK
jgi:myo-inositol 2-dehydrogenase / D-chiro-inositol 1-dehydrogenase